MKKKIIIFLAFMLACSLPLVAGKNQHKGANKICRMKPKDFGKFIRDLEEGGIGEGEKSEKWKKFFSPNKEKRTEEYKDATADKENLPPTPPKQAQQRFGGVKGMPGTLYTSPPKSTPSKVSVIYVWSVEFTKEDPINIPEDFRVDVAEVFKQAEINSGEYPERIVSHALLLTEIRLLELIKKNPSLIPRIIYVGLSERAVHERAKEHVKSLKTNTHKSEIVRSILEKGLNIRSSYLLYNVGESYLKTFECLVGNLFATEEFGASKLLGDEAAWEVLNRYLRWKPRIATLKEKGLFNIHQELLQTLGDAAREFLSKKDK